MTLIQLSTTNRGQNSTRRGLIPPNFHQNMGHYILSVLLTNHDRYVKHQPSRRWKWRRQRSREKIVPVFSAVFRAYLSHFYLVFCIFHMSRLLVGLGEQCSHGFGALLQNYALLNWWYIFFLARANPSWSSPFALIIRTGEFVDLGLECFIGRIQG